MAVDDTIRFRSEQFGWFAGIGPAGKMAGEDVCAWIRQALPQLGWESVTSHEWGWQMNSAWADGSRRDLLVRTLEPHAGT